MAYPTAIVEIGFDDGPYVASPTWTDVTQYVRRMFIDRGRSDDWGDFNSTATVVLNNRTRLFDPYYTAGTYYGKLLPRRQIRIRAVGASGTYDVFRGFIDGWNPEWTAAGTDSTTTIQCFDALQLLAGEQLPADWSREYILSLNPRHYYPLDEPIVTQTTTTLRDLGSFPQPLTAFNAVSDRELAFGLPQKSLQTTGASSALVTDTTARSFCASAWANYGGGVLVWAGRFYASMYFDSADNRYTVDVSDQATATQYRYKTTDTFEGGDPFMLTFNWFAPGLFGEMFLNGTSVTTSVTTSAIFIPIGNSEGILLSGGQYQQVLVFHALLSAGTIKTIYNLSDALFPETTAQRFDRIIAETPFPYALTNSSAPSNSVLDITNDAPTVTSELRLAAMSEGGPLFVNKSGVLTMFNQNQIRTQSRSITSQVTYGEGGVDIGTDVQILTDGDSMRNQVFVTMSGGGVIKHENTSSISAYGTASMSMDTQVQTIANAQSLANIAVGWGSYMYPLLSPVNVVLDPAGNWDSTLALELMDRVTVKIKPPTGNTITQPMLVQRIQHDVVPGFWQTTIEGSARWAAVFILNQSTLNGTDLLG